MKRILTGVGLLGLLWGCGSDDERPCGPVCDDAQPSSSALQICSGKAGEARQGEIRGVTWTDEVAFTADDVVADCERLCGFAARCSDEDEAACAAQCPSVAAQAHEQACEQSLMTAMECLARNACDGALPRLSSAHPSPRACDLAVGAVSCTILPEIDGPTVLDLFQGVDAHGFHEVADQGSSNDLHGCARYLGGSPSATILDIQCRRGHTSSWCCECNVDQQPVRAFAENADSCPAGDVARAAEICGWRY